MGMNWRGKRVLLTGHTGFKGSWLSLWLAQRRADVCGIALDPSAGPSLFEDARVASTMRSVIGDIRDARLLTRVFREHRPEIVLHLAAQPLVRQSYLDPLGTYAVNVMGTAHVLEAARQVDSVRAIVVVTTDKCYENREWEWPYREIDPLGGYDPYSSSKACAEMVVAAYRNSFFNPADYAKHGVAIATARAGNVIGGGDWAEDRLVPDIFRAFTAGRVVRIRCPHAVRPWQHVLEPLRGYITLAESLHDDGIANGEAFNFGPELSDCRPVEWIVGELAELWGNNARWETDDATQSHEAQTLKLDCSKAASRLGWRPRLALHGALAMTTAWYRARQESIDMRVFTLAQIEDYANEPAVNRQPTEPFAAVNS
jgi:CDP-glucose 4,6-dehydratase